MSRIIKTHEDLDAIDAHDDASEARSTFVKRYETVPLKLEMDTAEGWAVFNNLPDNILPPLPPSGTICICRSYSPIV